METSLWKAEAKQMMLEVPFENVLVAHRMVVFTTLKNEIVRVGRFSRLTFLNWVRLRRGHRPEVGKSTES